ncbi:branched-chain amino acid transport system / permease component family protein, partial [Vibrio parahaemolyticus VP2007-007]
AYDQWSAYDVCGL